MSTGTVIAVTGDVGAGKSTVSKLFEELGGVRIDADHVVAQLWRREDIVEAAAARWGRGILGDDGRVVHARIAAVIFEDRNEYDWVCALLHPRVEGEIGRRVAELSPAEWAVVEIPLLFEAGVAPWVTAIVFVTASRAVRLKRCRLRGWDEREVERRESFFIPSEQRMARSDCIVRNDGTIEELKAAVKGVYLSGVR